MTNVIRKDNNINVLYKTVFNEKEWTWLVFIQALKATDDHYIRLHPESFIESPYAEVVYPFRSDEFAEAWLNWKRERAKKKIKKYTTTGEQAQLKRIYDMCRGDEALAIASVNESNAQGHHGVYLAKGYKSNPLQKFFNT